MTPYAVITKTHGIPTVLGVTHSKRIATLYAERHNGEVVEITKAKFNLHKNKLLRA